MLNYFFVLITINAGNNEGNMANNRMTEGVGKKIVEALKMQSDIEITPIQQEVTPEIQPVVEEPVENDDFNFDDELFAEEETSVNTASFDIPEPQVVEPQTIPHISIPEKTVELDNFEVPTNVAVLKQLITKLPAGVTKQTGALIIKQTMEALGISMKSVLQEAQMVQEGLNNSSKECQASILEYKKQIGILERQAQQYQRQYAALNDIISLFIQTNI